MKRYWKPKSGTWLISFAHILVGVFLAALPLHGLHDWAEVIYNMTDASSAELIRTGMLGVTVRGALGDDVRI